MENKDKEKCPVCGNEEYERISIPNSPSFCLGVKGSVKILCCTNYGVLRASKDDMEYRITTCPSNQ